MTTTDAAALQERIARALYENAEYYGPEPIQPPWDSRDDEERGEWMEIAAAVLPIVAVEVRKAKAQALREAAPLMHDFHDAAWLETQAAEYETGDSDEHR